MSSSALLAATLVVSLVVYAWSIKAYFRRGRRMPRGMQVLALAACAAGGFQLWGVLTARPAWAPTVCGVASQVAGLLLFTWVLLRVPRGKLAVAHSEQQGEWVATSGPFKWCRHPCYTAYSLTWLGCCIAVPRVATCVPAAVLIGWYVCLARAEEAQLIASKGGKAYTAYRERVSWFGPRWALGRRAGASSDSKVEGSQHAGT